MALSAIIFDVDGTLVDTNALHVEAWKHALAALGYTVNSDRIFPEIGKGGDTLVPDLLGKQADERDGDALRKAQPRAFKELAEKNGIRVFGGAVQLIEEVKRRGLKTIIATSSGNAQMDVIEKHSGVKWTELVDDMVNADDISKSKPAPDLVSTAVQTLGVSAAECAMVGDTRYDAISAKHAGVICLGLASGGNSVDPLMNAGCRHVWKDTAELLANLDDALLLASPGIEKPTIGFLETLMRDALQHAELAMQSGEAPIAALLARGNGQVVARGFNEFNRSRNKTAHAEIVTFAHAAGKVDSNANDLILVSTLEPCVMCTGAAMEAAVDTIVFALKAPADSGTGRVQPPRSPESVMPRIVPNVLGHLSLALFKRWLAEFDVPEQQRKFGEQLLRSHSE